MSHTDTSTTVAALAQTTDRLTLVDIVENDLELAQYDSVSECGWYDVSDGSRVYNENGEITEIRVPASQKENTDVPAVVAEWAAENDVEIRFHTGGLHSERHGTRGVVELVDGQKVHYTLYNTVATIDGDLVSE
jgi:hypothetical protein